MQAESETLMTSTVQNEKKYHRALIYGLLNGPIVYSVYFLIVYFLVEGSCKSGLINAQFLGFGLVMSVIILLTVVAAVATAAAGWIAWRNLQHAQRAPDRRDDAYSNFTLTAAIWLNGFFALMIVLTGLPVLLLEVCTWI
jgi:hypothetical protein